METRRQLIIRWLMAIGAGLVLATMGCQSEREERAGRIAERIVEAQERAEDPEFQRQQAERRAEREEASARRRCDAARSEADRTGHGLEPLASERLSESSTLSQRIAFCQGRDQWPAGREVIISMQCDGFLQAAMRSHDDCVGVLSEAELDAMGSE